MTSGSGVHSWRRIVTGSVTAGALALGLLVGAGAPMAAADPVAPAQPTPAADAPAAPQMTADEALSIIAKDYDTGEGGGQISTLIHDILKLRQQGFKPSNANREAITKALDKRPNQVPLIDALKSTLSYQRKLQAQSQAQIPKQGVVNPGIAPIPGGGAQPGGGIQIPLG
ncbi:hypothetical protein A5722_06935 [Mycobacterium vulneris]|uniref:Uncharacterized protein n=1 Tax=Mycolicibacterium porcinum TaxID=39693 RepID=A0AAP7VGP0_9MYCO|nr:hypothetical protein [Mycolicibacterium porcinum]OCB43299.1 hypothetical protein A5721_25120 [Mycolicibacterium vulneris]MCV7391643.1 hypothetical protein [Mycolicibacterium porcinum]OCB10473.1 hypothetical protein A5717_22735 [Mycolicibacterium porcinum]OCB58410.1 hypothetical protein A5722_06935 [Mycolicibacterium vulneris]OCB62346.1 hypothetical protein A5729_26425 [Mycolicibacterium vulneris]